MQFAVARDQQGKVMVAIKFFATQEEFEVEETLYLRTPEVRHCMPCVVQSVNNKSGTVCDPFGNELPPHIVLERGVCLATVAASRRELGTTMIGKVCCLPALSACDGERAFEEMMLLLPPSSSAPVRVSSFKRQSCHSLNIVTLALV